MVEKTKTLQLLRMARSVLAIIYNEHFCWTFIKSYGLFSLAIPLAKYFDGFQVLLTGGV
ncbi:GD17493 [Drosophila simulans]|uniref:GD17493 n=1 Tax=Drosophila simulans TaxID=7240 RepID=B4R2Z1_DROSI|nr:GD17493 [Drosophila simulans]